VAVVGLLRVAAPRVVVAEVVLLVRARLLAAGLMRWMTIFRFRTYFVVFLLIKARLPRARGLFLYPHFVLWSSRV
jgi:hypothetical protein